MLSQTRQFKSKLEFGDALLFAYFLVIVRQWFWPLNDHTAWYLSVPLALLCWFLYIQTKTFIEAPPQLSFWLVVSLPLLAAYALRAPFPDTSFDVWGLRLFHGERALHGFLYLPGEFFPTAAPFNPTPDMLTGLSRYLLGYRLGTVINLLAMIWAGTILDRMLRNVITQAWLRAAGVLLVLLAEHLLFEINNYMPDLLALPILLEATRLTLASKEHNVQLVTVVRVAFLIGLAVTLKLSNGALAVPLVVIWVWRLLGVRTNRSRQFALTVLLSLLSLALLLLPFTVWVYRLTGSPIFPLYNKVFRSPLYPPLNGWDNRWGGYGMWEILAWPVLIFFKPERTAELPVYSGRLSVGFVAAIVCLLLWRRINPITRTIAFIIVLGSLLWSVTMGYIRYGLYLEVLSGVLLLVVSSTLFRTAQRTVWNWRLLVAGLICTVLVAQSALAGFYLTRQEWSMRPTAFDDFNSFKQESTHLLRDRSVRGLLSEHDRRLFDQVEVWVVSGAKTAGLMYLLNDKPPFVGVRSAGLFLAPANREAFETTLTRYEGKKMWSLALPSDYAEALLSLRNVGLNVGRAESVVIPFFSADDRVIAYFFEVTRDGSKRPPAERTSSQSMLPDNAYRSNISEIHVPPTVKVGETPTLFFRVQNEGGTLWPSLGRADGQYQVRMRSQWLSSDGSRQMGAPSFTSLPFDLLPGDSTVIPIMPHAPLATGKYWLEVDMVQQDVTSFADKGSQSLRVEVLVEN